MDQTIVHGITLQYTFIFFQTYSNVYFPDNQKIDEIASQADIFVISIGSGMAFFILAGLVVFIIKKYRQRGGGFISDHLDSESHDSSELPLDHLDKIEKSKTGKYHTSQISQLREGLLKCNPVDLDDQWLLFDNGS